MLSSDLEQNPDPISASEQAILVALASEQRVLGEIKDVRSEISSIKTDIANIKSECLRNKQELFDIKTSQIETARAVKLINEDIIDMRGEKEAMQPDIDYFNNVFETKLIMLEDIEDDVDK